jgi:hypothetical protein
MIGVVGDQGQVVNLPCCSPRFLVTQGVIDPFQAIGVDEQQRHLFLS